MNDHYDVVIVGGNLIGAACAAALMQNAHRAPLEILVLDPLPSQPPLKPFDPRVVALNRASINFLHHFGVWSLLEKSRIAAFEQMHVWDAAGPGEIHFDSAQVHTTELGYIVENQHLLRALHQRLEANQYVTLCQEPLQALSARGSSVSVQLGDGTGVRCRLVIGADGSLSEVRTQSGIAVRGWNYSQRAVVATVDTEHGHQHTAWQRFLATGPLAFLPLPNKYCAVVWSADDDTAQTLLAMNDEAFGEALTEASQHRLGKITVATSRLSFPLRLQHAEHYTALRTALIGDAAHTVHPLAGLGANLGLMDAAALAQLVCAAHRRGEDIASQRLLRRYERWRKTENVITMAALDALKRLFAAPQPVGIIRNIGLTAVNGLAPIKRRIIQKAMGLSGELPEAARGVDS